MSATSETTHQHWQNHACCLQVRSASYFPTQTQGLGQISVLMVVRRPRGPATAGDAIRLTCPGLLPRTAPQLPTFDAGLLGLPATRWLHDLAPSPMPLPVAAPGTTREAPLVPCVLVPRHARPSIAPAPRLSPAEPPLASPSPVSPARTASPGRDLLVAT